MRVWKASVTFEFESRAPETWVGAIKSASLPTAFARAIRAARKVIEPRCVMSTVALLEEDEGETIPS